MAERYSELVRQVTHHLRRGQTAPAALRVRTQRTYSHPGATIGYVTAGEIENQVMPAAPAILSAVSNANFAETIALQWVSYPRTGTILRSPAFVSELRIAAILRSVHAKVTTIYRQFTLDSREGCPRVHGEPRSTIATSVCTKSSPLKRSGSPVEIASAYEKQSS